MSYQTIDTRHWHNKYEEGTNLDRNMTDSCFEAVADTLRGWGFGGSPSDKAEGVVAAIYRYIILSREEQNSSPNPYVFPLLNPDHPRISADQDEEELAYQIAKQTQDNK